MNTHRSTTALVHILDILSMLNSKSLTLTLTTNPPLRLKRDTRIPASYGSMNSSASRIERGRCLAIKSGLVSGRANDVFPEVATGCGSGKVSGERSFAAGRVVFEVLLEELEVVPDLAGLVVAAVDFAFEDCDVGLDGS
jgi:hypothetical protein